MGALSYNGVPDTTFAGGFAGIESTIPFNIARLMFNSVAAPAFALDNIRTATTTVPEPWTMLLNGPERVAAFLSGAVCAPLEYMAPHPGG